MSKHRELLDYIEALEYGKKVSVRGLANRLSVSEGTAYRAIKEAENRGLVAVIDRAGTVRVAPRASEKIEKLTYQEIVNLVNAEVLAGSQGLDNEFSKFSIGAMTAKNAEKYMNKGGLLIVGDRGNIQKIALEAHNAVLVTGGLPVEQDILDLADREGYPVMRSNFDTFTVASRINRILSNEIIRKDITTVGDIYDKTDSNNVLQETDTVKRYLELVKKTNVSRFPIVNKYNLVVGVIAMRDTAGKSPSTLVDKIMSRSAITAKQDETVASVSQKMLSDGLEMLPVVDNANKLLGTITKTNVMRSMREAQENAQFAHTFTDQLSNAVHEEQGYYAFKVEAMMMNNLGYISYGTLSEVASDITMRVINKTTTKNVMIEQMTIHFVEAVNIDDTLEVYPKIISESRLGATVDLEVYLDYKIVSKIIVTVRLQ